MQGRDTWHVTRDISWHTHIGTIGSGRLRAWHEDSQAPGISRTHGRRVSKMRNWTWHCCCVQWAECFMTLVSLYDVIVHCRPGRHGRGGHAGGMEMDVRGDGRRFIYLLLQVGGKMGWCGLEFLNFYIDTWKTCSDCNAQSTAHFRLHGQKILKFSQVKF